MDRAIIHVDMDAFYASVEQRDDPSLRGVPVIVGGHPTRGVVLAASYEVRPFGVRSAMPMSRAVKAAPHARVVPPRFEKYIEASEHVFRIFEDFTPLIEPLSLDEAFLDVGASVKLLGPAPEIATRIRARIRDEVGLPASAGIAAVKFVAKIASDHAKPNGQHHVPAADTLSFLAPLPVSRLWGVGPRTEETLRAVGLRTIGDVARADPTWLEQRLGSAGPHLYALANGRDDREVVPDRAAKSIGAEDTFEEDLVGADALRPHMHAQAERVAHRMRRAGVMARVVQLKLKDASFHVITRRMTLEMPTSDGKTLYRAACQLLERVELRGGYRLTGVSAQDLVPGAQLPLLDTTHRRAERLNAAMDAITQRFGRDSVTTADIADIEGHALRDAPRRHADVNLVDSLDRRGRRTS